MMERQIQELVKKISEQKETIILEQLNQLLSRGLLVWEQGAEMITQDPMTNNLRVVSSGRLVLKNEEYVSRIESENKELRAIVEGLQTALSTLRKS